MTCSRDTGSITLSKRKLYILLVVTGQDSKFLVESSLFTQGSWRHYSRILQAKADTDF
jgi:hypothetical protein